MIFWTYCLKSHTLVHSIEASSWNHTSPTGPQYSSTSPSGPCETADSPPLWVSWWASDNPTAWDPGCSGAAAGIAGSGSERLRRSANCISIWGRSNGRSTGCPVPPVGWCAPRRTAAGHRQRHYSESPTARGQQRVVHWRADLGKRDVIYDGVTLCVCQRTSTPVAHPDMHATTSRIDKQDVFEPKLFSQDLVKNHHGIVHKTPTFWADIRSLAAIANLRNKSPEIATGE